MSRAMIRSSSSFFSFAILFTSGARLPAESEASILTQNLIFNRLRFQPRLPVWDAGGVFALRPIERFGRRRAGVVKAPERFVERPAVEVVGRDIGRVVGAGAADEGRRASGEERQRDGRARCLLPEGAAGVYEPGPRVHGQGPPAAAGED